MALLYLVRLLIDPLEIESHHANRYLHGRPVGDEGRHPGGDTDLQVMRCLVGTVVGGARTGGVLARTVSIGQARLIEKAEYLAAPDRHIGAQEAGYLVLMLQIIEVVEADVEILAEVQLEIFQVEVVAVIGETHTRGDIIAEEIAHIGTDTEIIAVPLHVFQDEEIQVPLVVLGVRDGSARHPCTFRDEDGLLHFSVDAIDGSLATLGPSLPHAKGAKEG